MKHLLSFLFVICFGQWCEAQTALPLDENGNVTFTEVVSADSSTAQQLFSAALLWFGNTFKSPKDVIEIKDKESTTILAKGNTSMDWSVGSGYLSFTLQVSAKEDRYKYTFSNLKYQDRPIRYPAIEINRLIGVNSKGAERCRKNVMAAINAMSGSLKSTLSKKENW